MLVVVVLLIIVVVKHCSNERLKGTWTVAGGEYSFTFTDKEKGYISYNGTVSYSSDRTLDFTYHIDGDELVIKTETTLYSYSDVFRFTFEVSGDKLVLTEVESGDTEVFYKE